MTKFICIHGHFYQPPRENPWLESVEVQDSNHMSLPLANARDKFTQVFWGIRDFEARFGRKPEGMWLAETAADPATLDALAEQGIKFTVLSPFQARLVRKIGEQPWQDV